MGIVTTLLLLVALWPEEIAVQEVVVAARDLGAGAVIQAADLTLTTMPSEQAPADAVADTASLVGQTLSVVRFSGEPVTVRHLGPVVALEADERGIAVQVDADTGLAGLLRPGMEVGLVATLETELGTPFAKSLLEGLRVLYVPPDFQARPYTPLSAQMQVLGDGTTTPVVGTLAQQSLRSGVVVLAASTQPVNVVYAMPTVDETDAQTERQQRITELFGEEVAERVAANEAAGDEEPAPEPPTIEVVPLELLAALNAADASFTLVLMPEQADAYTTIGLELASVLVDIADEESQP